MNKISVIMVTRNEERNIRQCLDTVKWADEIILVDQSSSDNTVKIAREFTDKVFVVPPKGYCEPDRIMALEKARFDWVLCIDADERITEGLSKEIKSTLLSNDSPECNGYFIPRINYIFGKRMRHGGHGSDKQLRFFRKNNTVLSEKIHEPPVVKGCLGEFKNHMEHYSTNTISEYCKKLSSYTDKEAKRMSEDGIRFSILQITVKPIGKFVYQYVFQLGFMDGIEGLLFYSLSAFYVFLKHIKLWETERVLG